MLLPKQHLNRPEPLNSSELRGECRLVPPYPLWFLSSDSRQTASLRKGAQKFPAPQKSGSPQASPFEYIFLYFHLQYTWWGYIMTLERGDTNGREQGMLPQEKRTFREGI